MQAIGAFIGELGFADFKRDIVEPMRNVPEIGWVLAPEFHGRGFATEAVTAAIAWADEHLPEPRTVCLINPENTASLRIAEKCGYHNFSHTELASSKVMLFERTRQNT